MKTNIKYYILILASVLTLNACNSPEENEGSELEQEESENEVFFLDRQFKVLGLKVDTIPLRNLSTYVEVNGRLEVPPQDEASVTAIIGSNVTSIKVIEGDKVKKGQVLAYLSHPDLIKLQTDYVTSWSQLQFLEKEYQRQKKLYAEQVGSGKEFQKIQAEYQSMKGLVKGYEAQLRLMGLNTGNIQQSDIYAQVPVISPIDGQVQLVDVKTGQYVLPQTEMFQIVNIEHIHADLMVFERDMHKVMEGQSVKFRVESLPHKELEATIYAVGQTFERDPKAIQLHAEIKNREGLLIPGMYLRGRILVDNVASHALPESGIVREGDKHYLFVAERTTKNEESGWEFMPVEVVVGTSDDGWVEINFLQPLEESAQVAWNNAYYLLAEMKKGELEEDE